MFNFLRSAVSAAANRIRATIAPRPAPKPAPRPPQRHAPKAPIPATSFRPIANWGESSHSIAQRTAQWIASPARKIQSNWQNQQRAQQQAAAAAATRAKLEAESAARAAALRQRAQSLFDSKTSWMRGHLSKAATTAKSWLKPTTATPSHKQNHEGFKNQKEANNFNKWFAQQTPERQKEVTEFNKTKNFYANQARSIVDSQKKPTSKGWFSTAIDKITFGQDRREQDARTFSQQQAQNTGTKNVKRYEDTLNTFLKSQTKRKATIENKRFSSQAEYDKAITEYTAWESDQVKNLEYTRAATTGMLEAYGQRAESKLTSRPSKLAGWFNTNIAQGAPGKALGNVWKYTLGQGSETAPSLVTALPRAVNTINNVINPNGQKNYHNGIVKNGIDPSKNAWQNSYNQRNLNYGQPQTISKEQWINNAYDRVIKPTGETKSSWIKRKGSSEIDRMYNETISSEKYRNYTGEFLADPTLAASGVLKFGSKGIAAGAKATGLTTAKPTTAATGWFKNASSKLKQNKIVSWLGKEHISPQQQLSDAITAAKVTQGKAQNELLPQINEINKKLSADQKLDVSVFDDLSKLSDSEAAMLQRMVGGKMSARDRIILYSPRGKNPAQQKLEQLAVRWTEFTEKMKMADNVEVTRFGKGQKLYAPDTSWLPKDKPNRLDRYNFFKKRGSQTLNSQDFNQGARDRYFKSRLDELGSSVEATEKTNLLSKRDSLLKRYDDSITPARAAVAKAEKKNKSLFAKTQKAIGAPTRLWKKSVLKYRPAWTVNNVLYNTQAGALASGPRSLVEQAKMINPRYWRKAMDESRATFGSDIGKEIGSKGKLNRFYSGVEDWTRVAAGRAAMKKGLSEKDALKRVDKYLFNYKTKNWERPLKTVMPFWAWNKNLTKAAVTMPTDRPLAAKSYNFIDRYQQTQFDKEFSELTPELLKLGYTEAEIEQIKQEHRKYYKGRLKTGEKDGKSKWITTPFNAFSEKGLSGLGFNPYLTATGETANSENSFGQKLKGAHSSFISRVGSKFPQAELARKAIKSYRVNTGADKPREGWIGAKGSSGYGLTKERQGFDPTKKNYNRSLDPRAKLSQDALAFVGIPRTLEFDKGKLVETKKLQKVTADYFSLNTKDMNFKDAEAARSSIFKKYGITSDEFYGGILAKYDTDNTTKIKDLKQIAATKNKTLFSEYGKQPKGTRSAWAADKLRQLVKEGYFNDNPFLKSFDWVNPTSIAKADRGKAYKLAKTTGDWSQWRAKYGDTRSQKAKDYQLAKTSGDWTQWRTKYGATKKAAAYEKASTTGDWTEYRKEYGTKKTAFEYDGKYFKTPESMNKYKEGLFWKKYADSDKSERKQLLATNPQYNRRADWTIKQWDEDKTKKKAELLKKARTISGFSARLDTHVSENSRKSAQFIAMRKSKPRKSVVWK